MKNLVFIISFILLELFLTLLITKFVSLILNWLRLGASADFGVWLLIYIILLPIILLIFSKIFLKSTDYGNLSFISKYFLTFVIILLSLIVTNTVPFFDIAT